MSTHRSLHIAIVSPTAATRRTGNLHTAQRYASLLRAAGHRVRVYSGWNGESADVLIALHARKSAESVFRFAQTYPERPVVVVLTGTDVYRDLARSKRAERALELASGIITLQPDAATRVPQRLRAKITPIVQSARVTRLWHPPADSARFCVLGHLRSEKDPLRAAYALRYVPRALDAGVVQAGAALDERYLRAAEAIVRRDARYRYLGDVSHARALAVLASSSALVLSSKMEGGANVLCEAIAAGTPVIASRISGNVGILGPDYPAYYPVGDTRACAALMRRCAQEPAFLRALSARVKRLRPLVAPAREQRSLLAVVSRVMRRD